MNMTITEFIEAAEQNYPAGSIGNCVRHGFWRAACNQREEI